MSSAANKALVQRLVTEMIQGGDLSLAAELFDPAYVAHDPSNPTRAGGIVGATQFIAMLHEMATDLRYTATYWLADGDLVSYYWTLQFTHSGPLMGVPPSGKAVTVTGIDMFRVSHGKIVESWAYADALGMLQQMGVLPPLGPPPGNAAQS